MINLQEQVPDLHTKCPVIWKLDHENCWELFSNTDHQPPFSLEESSDDKDLKEKSKAKTNTDSPFYITKQKQEVKGTTICTPKGYGIIQSVDHIKDTIQVKIQGIIHEFDKKDAMNEVPISILLISNSMKTEQTFYFPANSTLQEVFSKLENSIESKTKHIELNLFLEGKELTPSNDTIEKLRINPFTKIIATIRQGKTYTISRFLNISQGWGVGNRCIDGVAFHTSKNIRLIGVGSYPFENPSSLNCVINLHAGEGIAGEIIYTQEAVVMKKSEDNVSKTAIRLMFDKPVLLMANEPYTLTIMFRSSGSCCYGTQGKASVEGEDGTVFSFKYASIGDNDNGTEVGSGLLPELYYYT